MTTHLDPTTRGAREDTGDHGSPPLVRRALAEFAGTGLLVFLGVSAMLVVSRAVASPSAAVPGGRHVLGVLMGLAFGYTVALLIHSPIGRVSGQFNPAVSLLHRIAGRLSTGTLVVYVVAQVSGGVLGAALLLVWGGLGADLRYGATTPLPDVPLWIPAAAEVGSTMVVALAVVAITGGRVTGRWAFHLIPMLYGAFGPVVAPLSGLSTNPARTLGPAIVTGLHDHLWLYVVAPPLGAVLAVLAVPVVRRARRRTRRPTES